MEKRLTSVFYKLAAESDIEEIYNFVKTAVYNMEKQSIFQWDELYPVKRRFS